MAYNPNAKHLKKYIIKLDANDGKYYPVSDVHNRAAGSRGMMTIREARIKARDLNKGNKK